MMTHVAIEYHRELNFRKLVNGPVCCPHITALMDDLFFSSAFKLIISRERKKCLEDIQAFFCMRWQASIVSQFEDIQGVAVHLNKT